jgi:hypothetical protein
MQKPLKTQVSQLLEEAGTLARQGKREKAYQASLRATTMAPDESLAWYLRSQNAPSPEEQLMCLSHAYSLAPDHPETRKELHSAVHGLLKQEPFLAYVYETEQFYQVRSASAGCLSPCWRCSWAVWERCSLRRSPPSRLYASRQPRPPMESGRGC